MDTEFGATQIMVTIPYEGEQAEGEPTNMGQVLHTTYEALAAWGELLGQSPGQTIQTMLDSATTPEQVDEDGRNPWTIAYEALDAALSDTAATTMVLTADEASLNDPLTAAQQRTLSALGATTTTRPARARSKRSTDTSVAAMFDMAIAEDSTASAALNQAQEQFYQQFMPEERNNNER